jgi:hypothetical protein
MIKKIVALLVCIFCASLCWGQYTINYTIGLTDITSYLPTTNAWHLLGGGQVCIPNTLSVGYDGTLMCIGTNGYAASFDRATQSWTQLTSMGLGIQGLAVLDVSHVWVLKADSGCNDGHNPPNLKNYMWNGASYTTGTGCGRVLSVGSDGLLVFTNYQGGTYSSLNGSSWTQISGGSYGPTLSYAEAASNLSMCGVGAGLVYAQMGSQAAFTQLSAQPGGTPIGCVIYEGNDPGIFTWNSSGVVKAYNIGNGTWSAVAGTMYGLTSETKAKTLGLDASGQPFHLNVYAGYISGTISGSYSGCPTPAQPCTSGVTHTAKVKITLPGGLFGSQATQTAAPNVNMNVSSFDSSVGCDPFFGPSGSDWCNPTVIATVLCNVSQQFIPVQGGGGAPPPPTPPHYQISQNYVKWDSTRFLDSSFAWRGNGWSSTARCGTTISGCTVGTLPYCGVDDLQFTEAARPSTKAIQDSVALLQCALGPFAVTAVYIPGQPNSCVQVTVDKRAKTPQPCF